MSLKLNPESSKLVRNKDLLLLAGISALAMCLYLLASRIFYMSGFPLDDAWIHQTYARNLAQEGEWSFIKGQLSGGSTAPLWSILLSLGFLLRLSPYYWTYFLGFICLWRIAVLSENGVRKIVASYRPRFPWIGTILALEWHLAWASVSGMETLLFTLLVLTAMIHLATNSRNFFLLGLIIGISIWVRPDGITLLGPSLLAAFLLGKTWKSRLRSILDLSLVFGALYALYLIFNLKVNETPFPGTFYAKQAEYKELLQTSFLIRLGKELLLPMVGVGVLLLPGYIFMIIDSVKKRSWGLLLGATWMFGYLVLYAWKLPVVYQHGRYVIPSMAIYILIGLMGWVTLDRYSTIRWKRMLLTTWRLSIAMVVLAFYLWGALTYAQDVAFIESEMVATAKWIDENIPPEATIAAHDIGALGYFDHHRLVDLAGLISPDVIPFIRDESMLASHLDDQGVNFLVIFPDWYQSLPEGREIVYSSNGEFLAILGQENMTVYRWLP